MQCSTCRVHVGYFKCMNSTKLMVLAVLCLQNSMFTVLRRYSQGVLQELYSKVRLFRSMHDVIDGESHILTVMLLPLSCRADAASPHRRRKSCTSRRYGSFKCMARHSFTCTTRRFSPAATSSSPPTHRECRCGRLRPKLHVHAPDSCFVGQFLHPITKEELHSPFFFSDLQRWEYT